MSPSAQFLTPKMLAERTGTSRSLIYAWCETGELAHVRLGAAGRRGKIVISEDDWTAFLAARRVEGTAVRTGAPNRPGPEFKHLKVRQPSG